jgi:hypothetical protein
MNSPPFSGGTLNGWTRQAKKRSQRFTGNREKQGGYNGKGEKMQQKGSGKQMPENTEGATRF